MLTANGHRVELLASFAVKGQPVGKQRHRDGRYGRKYTPAKTADYEKRIAWTTASQRNMREPQIAKPDDTLFVRVRAIFERPKHLRRASAPAGLIIKRTKPDADNILKSVCDAVCSTVVMPSNDARFVGVECWKYWAERDGDGPRTEIEIYRVLT